MNYEGLYWALVASLTPLLGPAMAFQVAFFSALTLLYAKGQ